MTARAYGVEDAKGEMRAAVDSIEVMKARLLEAARRLGGEKDLGLSSWLAGMCLQGAESLADVARKLRSDIREGTRAKQAKRAAEIRADDRMIARRRARRQADSSV